MQLVSRLVGSLTCKQIPVTYSVNGQKKGYPKVPLACYAAAMLLSNNVDCIKISKRLLQTSDN